jgi:hypothetical protein
VEDIKKTNKMKTELNNALRRMRTGAALSESDCIIIESAISPNPPNSFVEAVEPIMQYLADHRNPHVTVIVTNSRAELVEGVQCHVTYKFIK